MLPVKKIKALLKRLRVFFLLTCRYRFRAVGKDVYFGKRLYVKAGSVVLGDKVFIGNYCHLSVSDLTIGSYTMLASFVAVVGGDHYFLKIGTPIIDAGHAPLRKGVKIERDCWIGHGAIILDGVSIGEGSVIGAGALVTRSVPPYEVHVGVPARKVKDRFDRLEDRLQHSRQINGDYYKSFMANPIA
ncbi:acyltransferase [Chitinophaga japonensis]|uniref:Acetyltransferase-like isoleucine patch superfamily enzyme n=1 Tax=Chitinophaga japonensis TaxID=104662 RepID=A0A562T0D1_CHIJA|nr:acyltransferase [Chitinophaga japonensis]TWI86932.1 acetyltransferase-like isoleucine patch superfamily enzyme [Chitinophaga japonensis]